MCPSPWRSGHRTRPGHLESRRGAAATQGGVAVKRELVQEKKTRAALGELALLGRPGAHLVLRELTGLEDEVLDERERRADVGVGRELGGGEDVSLGADVLEARLP